LVQSVVIGLNAVVVAVTENVPRILTVQRAEHELARPQSTLADAAEALDALPFGPLDPAGDRTLELGLRRWCASRPGSKSDTWSSSIPSATATVTQSSSRAAPASSL